MAKIIDGNGYRTYFDIPITTEGVYEYAGFQIDPCGKFGIDAKKIYNVYRPCSELISDEFMKSLEEMPLTDDHTPLGEGPGLIPAEKNTHGVLFNIRKNDERNGLLGDIKVFSESMKKKIDGGKKEISLGYTCKYRPEMGMFGGKPYDFVQFDLYANHCALVDEARMGHACRVSDSKSVTQDSIVLPDEIGGTGDTKMSADELIEAFNGCSDEDKKKVKDALFPDDKPEEKAKDEESDKPEDKPDDCDEKSEEKPEDPKEDCKDADEESEDESDDKKEDDKEDIKSACDSAVKAALEHYQEAQRLAEQCKPVFGNISMDGIFTEEDVAVKICSMDSSLKKIAKKDCVAALRGYLAGRGKVNSGGVSCDSKCADAKFDFSKAFSGRIKK